jgi:hypothetical protein
VYFSGKHNNKGENSILYGGCRGRNTLSTHAKRAMITLTSKVQYKHFEAGEFTDVQQRGYDETITLIGAFPWEVQRDKIEISLTNPSITIEGKNNDCLKIAPFYHHQYVLYYLDNRQTLYTKRLKDLQDGFIYIKNYFEQPGFDPAGFKKEITWFRDNTQHFVTQDFRYLLTPKSIRSYLLSTSGINFLLSISFLIMFLVAGKTVSIVGILVLLLILFMVGGGLNLLLFAGYYRFLRDKILIMSRGNDTFYFGDIAHPVKYDKKDLLRYTTIKSSGPKNPVGGFAIIKMEFKDGTVLQVPNLLVDHYVLERKLFGYNKVEEHRMPFLKSRYIHHR